jgi:copper chaperone CopZ
MAATLVSIARAVILACIPMLAGIGGCETSQAAAPQTRDDDGELTLHVEGMACESCASRLESTLRKLEGVETATVDFTQKRARIGFEPARTNLETILKAMEEEGFQASIDER